MMVEFQDICGKICPRSQKVPLSGKLNISAGEETSLTQGEFGDQGAVVLESDPVLVIGVEASPAPVVLIPQDFCVDRADREGFASAKVCDRDLLFAGGGNDPVVAVDVLFTALIKLAAALLIPGTDIFSGGIGIRQIYPLYMKPGIPDDGGGVIAVIFMKMRNIEAQISDPSFLEITGHGILRVF